MQESISNQHCQRFSTLVIRMLVDDMFEYMRSALANLVNFPSVSITNTVHKLANRTLVDKMFEYLLINPRLTKK